MEYSKYEKELLGFKGKQIFIKRLSNELFNDYSKFICSECIETRILAGTTRIPAIDDLIMYMEYLAKDSSTIYMLIYKKDSNKIIGEVVLSEIDNNNKTANIRIEIGQQEDFRHGYGFESLFIFLNYGFGMLDLRTIELEVIEDNIGALKLYDKLGFLKTEVKESAYYYNYENKNLVIMNLSKEQFVENREKNIKIIFA